MKFLTNFLKGIVVGVGGVAPGLSGSVMLIILGLYEKAVNAIGTLFKNFKKNIAFLIPLVLGFGAGVLLFSKIVNFILKNYEFGTRYLFLGLVIGTVPLFYKQVKKNGFRTRMYLVVAGAVAVGLFLFSYNKNWFPVVTNPTTLQSGLLGVAVAGSSIVPGVDSAVILSALGLYELYVGSLAELNLAVLIPALGGLVVGAVLISAVMNFLIKRFYTMTFSVVFGFFLAIIPNVLNETCKIGSVSGGILALVLVVAGFFASYYLGNMRKNNQMLKKFINSRKSKD